MKLTAAGLSDVGRERDHNEDSYAVEDDLGLYIVCDGMGGHQAGEIASALAINAVVDYVKSHGDAADKVEMLAESAREANRRVIEEGSRNRKRKGIGSTLVAMLRDGDQMGIVHVGDSRAYLYRDHKMQRLTRDHSLIEELAGDDPAALAALGGYSNVITRAIGTAPDTQPDKRTEAMRPGDLFLLCSDGLCGVVKDADIEKVLLRVGDELDLAAACKLLVQRANEHGGPDNISTVLVRVEA